MNKIDSAQTKFFAYWKMILCEAWNKSWNKWGMRGIILPGIVSLLAVWIPNWGKSLGLILGENWMLYAFLFILLYVVTVVFFILIEPVFVYNKDQKNILDLKKEIHELKSEFPNVMFFDCGKNDILANINSYGANSLLGKYLNTERTLLYIDFVNKPEIQKNNPAIGVSVYLKYYDEDGNTVNRKHYGRWMEMPETVLGEKHIKTNISSDGRTPKRLGIGYYDKGGNRTLSLLDAEETDLSQHGIMNGSSIQFLDIGKYFVVASVSGDNIQDISPLVFEIEIRKDGRLEFKQKKDVDEFLKKIRESEKTSNPWPSVN